jgi:hypothetical protein
MSQEQYNINFINRVLKNKTFEYDGPTFDTSISSAQMSGFIKYEVSEIIDIKNKIVIGEWKPVIYLNISIVNGDEAYINRMKQIKTILQNEQFNTIIRMFSAQMISEIREDLRNHLKSRIGFDGIVNVENIDFITHEDENNLVEGKIHRQAIRTIVRDIVSVLKNEGDGDYVLPEDINDNMTYEFINGPENITVELEIRPNEDVKSFLVNGNYIKDEDTVEVLIVYNPNENLKTMMYDIIGELNDLIGHELEHYNQYTTGEYDLEDDDESEESLHYYTKPYEIKAQIKGFKRLAKIRRMPLDSVIKNWFETHGDIHHLNHQDKETVINTLLNNV